MLIEKTSNIHVDDNIVMILYGRGGVGKTTFAASAPKPLLIDFENGSKFLGERGLDCDVVRLQDWFTHDDLVQLKGLLPNYETIILDPIGEAMEKLVSSHALDGKKFRQNDGSLSMAGWGEAKKQMKGLVKWLRDSGKNVILIAHVAEGKDDDKTTYRIQIATKLSDELPTMVDIISYMGIRKDADGKKQVVLYTPAQGGNYDSKDRTGRLPEVIPVSEGTGWADFKKAFRPVQNSPAPQQAPVPQKAEHPASVQETPGSLDNAKQDLKWLLDSYGDIILDEPRKQINALYANKNATYENYKVIIDRLKNYLRNKGVNV